MMSTMLYRDLLKERGEETCPFCDPKDRIITERETAYITYCLAPFCRHHALVIPKRHVLHVHEFTKEEWRDLSALISEGTQMLYALDHGFISVLMRDGRHPGKSVEHLHYHLAPDIDLRPESDIERSEREDRREILTKEQIAETLADFARVIKNS